MGYAYSVLGDFHLAEDAAQEAFLCVYRNLARLERPQAFPAWFRRIVHTYCDRLTRVKRLTMISLDESHDIASFAPNPAIAAQNRELQDKVLEAVQALPEDQRVVTTLFYIGGHSLSEVCEFLDLPVSTVKNRLHTARRQLRERMTDMVDRTMKQHTPGPKFSEEVLKRIPNVYDVFFNPARAWPLNDSQRELILSACPAGSEIVDDSFAATHDRAGCLVVRIDGKETMLMVTRSALENGTETEAALLPVLADLGLPVPRILAGPTVNPGQPEAGPTLVQSLPPGDFVRIGDGAQEPTATELDLYTRTILEGTVRLHALTKHIQKRPVAGVLPKRTLVSSLEAIIARGGPWMDDATYCGAIKRLQPVLKKIKTPLVFSNGTSMPSNYLHDGNGVSGFLRFDSACFEDPHIQFVKYVFWGGSRPVGYGAFSLTGLVERWLYSQGLSRAEFAPRVVLGCLWMFRCFSPTEAGHARAREFMFGLLEENLGYMR